MNLFLKVINEKILLQTEEEMVRIISFPVLSKDYQTNEYFETWNLGIASWILLAVEKTTQNNPIFEIE